METVNFQCGHCGNLMAATANMMGQQVRCPHCQQIVVAPAAAASPPALPAVPPPPTELPAPHAGAFNFSATEERESIFTPDEQVSEDVFGSVPRAHVEMPPAPPAPAFVPEAPPVPPSPAAPPPAPAEPMNPFADLSQPNPPRADVHVNAELTPSADGAAWSAPHEPSPWADAGAAAAQGEPNHDLRDPAPPRIAAPRGGGGLVIVALVIPLISYSILVTILAIMFWIQKDSIPHPFEALPDTDGDNSGKAKRQVLQDRVKADNPLPKKLRVALGQSITLGDLEVTPQRVELTTIRFRYPHGGSDPAKDASLVLRLQLRNVSSDVTFRPMDPYFLRAWNSNLASGMPYTYLEMGTQRFYGGPIRWTASARPGQRADVFVEGQNHDRDLRPGETMTSLVCTHPDLRIGNQLKNYQGRFLWRVQVRRGLIHWRDRDVAATAVLGVEFAKADIH